MRAYAPIRIKYYAKLQITVVAQMMVTFLTGKYYRNVKYAGKFYEFEIWKQRVGIDDF